jgi:hypothetical protein
MKGDFMKNRLTLVLTGVVISLTFLYPEGMLEKGSAPITIDEPKRTLVGQPAHLSGSSLPKIGKVTLKIVYPPQNHNDYTKSWVLHTPVEENGRYKIDFTETKKAGNYTITALAPDKKASTQATLHVHRLQGFNRHMVQEFINKNEALIDSADKKISILKDQLAEIPQSPATVELNQKLEKISDTLSKGKSRVEALKKPLKRMEEFIGDHKDSEELTEVFEPVFETLGDIAQKLDNERERLEEEFNRIADRKPTKCDDIDKIVTGLEFVSGSMQTALLLIDLPASVAEKGLSGSLMSVLKSQAIDLTSKTALDNNKNLPGAKRSIPTAEIQLGKSFLDFSLKEANKFKVWDKKLVALVNSAVGYAAGKILGQFCVKYTGDFSALFTAQYYAYNRVWWSYSIKLSGKLNLRYEKGPSSGPVKVTGEFEGNADKILVHDDLMAATPYMKRYVVFHVTLPPVASIVPGAQAAGKAVANEFGKMGRYGFGPYAFLVPVHGIIDKKKMILEVDKAVKDYGDNVKGTAWYILVEPSLPIPYVMTTDLPMVKAQFILSRGLRGKAEFDVTMDKKRATIQKTFTRTVKADNGEYKVDWLVKVKACNPNCLK